MTPGPTWQGLLAYALTGHPANPRGDDVTGVLAALAESGFPADRLRTLAVTAADEGQPWPYLVSAEDVRSVGPARWHALLREAQAALGLDGLLTAPPSTRTALTHDEQRLLRDVPPHHGT